MFMEQIKTLQNGYHAISQRWKNTVSLTYGTDFDRFSVQDVTASSAVIFYIIVLWNLSDEDHVVVVVVVGSHDACLEMHKIIRMEEDFVSDQTSKIQ